MKKLLYLIGPNFCVKNFADPLLERFSEYENFCVSDFPYIKSDIYSHIPIIIKRKPNIFYDTIALIKLIFLIYKLKPEKIIYSTPKISFIAVLVNKFFKIKSIYIHRGAIYQNFKGLHFYVYRKIDRFILKNSNKNIFISKSLFKYVDSLNSDLNLKYMRRFSSGQGVDLNRFSPKVLSEKKNTLTFGYLGRFHQDKGLDLIFKLIERYSSNNNIKFILKGFDDGFNFPTNWMKIYPNLNVIDWDDKVPEFFDSIDVNLFPSKREGFGNICIEAAAANIPTLGFNIPGVSDAICNEITGWLVNDESEFFHRVDELVHSPKEIANISKLTREYAEEYFDREKIINEIKKLIDD